MASQLIFNSALSGVQTLNSKWVNMADARCASLLISHPAITTQYSLQVSNSTLDAILNGVEKKATYSAVSIPLKSAADDFGVELSAPFGFEWFRVVCANTVGTGTPEIRMTMKSDK